MSEIRSLEMVEINDSKQWVYLRAKSLENPILLFVHGGPGASQIYCVDQYFKELEEHFIVVDWDQRGSGKSYTKNADREKLVINQYVEDIKALSQLLLTRFNKEQLFLVGHSWGSIIGLLAAEKYPELFHSYIGIGQVIDMVEGEKRGYDFALEQAKVTNNLADVKRLNKIGPPPHASLYKTALFRKVLDQYGGFKYGQKANIWDDIKEILVSEHYHFTDLLKWLRGINYLVKHFREQIITIDFKQQVKTMETPVYFLAGEFDYITPVSLVKEYIEILESPYKEVIVFNHAAHDCHFEHPEKFISVCLHILENSRQEKELK